MASDLPNKSYARIKVSLPLPKLIEVQLDSFIRLKKEGLGDLFHELSPIESYNKGMKLFFPSRSEESQQWGLSYRFDPPKHSIEECVERDLTYASPLWVSVLLAGTEVPEPKKQEIFLGDFPEMTEKGTFIINGTERVVVSQLIRSPGVYFEAPSDRATGRPLAMAKLIPDRGAWMEFETRKNDYIILKFNRKRTVPITVFLRALAAVSDGLPDSPLTTGSDEEIIALFNDVDNNPERMFITSSIKQEPVWEITPKQPIAVAALLEFFKRMRPGDPATLENAKQFLEEQLFDQRHYDLEKVGRYKLNQKLDLQEFIPVTHRTISKRDIIELIKRMIRINNGHEFADDIDHLGNRRVKTVGELIQNKLRIGMRRMERVIKERMSIRDQDQLTATTLINIRPMVAALREFFGSSQLSQFMDQTNPLAELRHKRTISALGPGGLTPRACRISMSVMFTTPIMAVSALLKPLKVQTLVLSDAWHPMPASTNTVSSKHHTAGCSKPLPRATSVSLVATAARRSLTPRPGSHPQTGRRDHREDIQSSAKDRKAAGHGGAIHL